MTFNTLLDSLQQSAPAVAIAESAWIYPGLETLHVIAIGLVYGSIVMVDLRLMGLAWRDRGVAEWIRTLLPWTWTAFACALLTGSALFSSKAATFAYNLPFQLKFAAIALAGVNMLVFHALVQPRLDAQGRAPGARLAGALSIALWTGVVCAGRWIGFTI